MKQVGEIGMYNQPLPPYHKDAIDIHNILAKYYNIDQIRFIYDYVVYIYACICNRISITYIYELYIILYLIIYIIPCHILL